MNRKYSEEELLTLLTSGATASLNQAISYLYQSQHWQRLLQKAISCPSSFFEEQYPKFLVYFKKWLQSSENRTLLKQKGLSKTLAQVWRTGIMTILENKEMLQLFRSAGETATFALQLCLQQFHQKIFATLIVIKADEEAVKEIILDTFIRVFEKLKDAGNDFTIEKSLEAYFMTSCKRAYWRQLNKHSVPMESLDLLSETLEYSITNDLQEQRTKCFEQKVFPKLGPACKRIISLSYLGYQNAIIAQQLDYSDAYLRRKKSTCLANARKLAKEICRDLS